MKPQIDAGTLDRQGASPHLLAMADGDPKRKAERESREAKLAQALRANLRRRKAAPSTPHEPKPHETSTD